MTGAFSRLTMLALALGGPPGTAADDAHATEPTAASNVDPLTYVYDPAHPTDPMDFAARAVDNWILNPHKIGSYNDQWPGEYCLCLENGYISSWYQNASALYLIDTCTPEEGFIMRTGHLQQRQVELLQSAMTCDMLKLMTYCFSHHAGKEALTLWQPKCSSVAYTTLSCDVDCSSAGRLGVGLSALLAFAAGAVLGA